MKETKRIVVAGLSASGKTTLVRALAQREHVLRVPEHNDWIGGSDNFPKVPLTIAEKHNKQEFFLRIDLERERWAASQRSPGSVVVADSDFLSPLAHNYAERWQNPELDVYAWLVERYCDLLEREELRPANCYLYLYVPLDERKRRRVGDLGRRRNEQFFADPFARRMERFYRVVMKEDSPRSAVKTLWWPYEGRQEAEEERIWATLQQSLGPDPTGDDVRRLCDVLRSTIADEPDDAT